MPIFKLLSFLPAFLLLLSCTSSIGSQQNPVALKDSAKKVATHHNQFAFDLYQQLRGQEGNLFFSPYSISTAFAMVYAGAQGETAEQMAKTMHFKLPAKEFHPANGNLIAFVNQSQTAAYQLHVANALWGQAGFRFLENFISLNQLHYEAGLQQLDFNNPAAAAGEINEWVREHTQEKITKLIQAGMITPGLTTLILTNAIYFKGDWQLPFDPEMTREDKFYLPGGGTTQVQMMYQKEDFPFYEDDNLKMLEMPYGGKDLSMILILPKQPKQLSDMESWITSDNLQKWSSSQTTREVKVYLPKFTMTYQSMLGELLQTMGMHHAFSGEADFSGITQQAPLQIAEVVHKAFIEVNEKGTEAAAATGILMEKTAMPINQPVFRADRPFFFLIKDKRTGSVLFMGRLQKPGTGG